MQNRVLVTKGGAAFHGLIGVARADITPPLGIYARNWGAATHDVATKVHLPLTLTVMAVSARPLDSPLVLIEADLGWWKSLQTFQAFQRRLLLALSIPSENLIFALSHTHSAPPLMDADAALPGSEQHQTWMVNLFELTVEAVRDAIAAQTAATLEWQSGKCSLATNRDLQDPRPGRTGVVCGYNPDIEADDSLVVGRVTDENGCVRATLVNYACHPTTLGWDNAAISPDYVGTLRSTLEFATDAPALFLLGACGELAPRSQYVGDLHEAERHGRQLGYAALSALSEMEPTGNRLGFSEIVESGAALAVWKHEPFVPSGELQASEAVAVLPLKGWPTAAELEQQRVACADRVFEERLNRKLNIRRGIGDGSEYRLTINVWRLGDAVIVGSCCEAYSYLQLELRRRFPDATIVCMNLVNGAIGYLPPADLYDVDVYPAWQTPFDRGSLEIVLETMTTAIRNVLSN